MNEIVSAISQTGWTDAVPTSYRSAASKQGSITQIDYASKDYVNDSSLITKTAYVYTPYGYDEKDSETKYDIIYLMHGWGVHAGEYFEYTKDLFDNLIEKGDIPPVIIVSPTFYNANSDTGFGGSVSEFRQFHLDFEDTNKVKFGLKNCHYAKATFGADGSVTYAKPVPIPGAVNLSLDPEGESDSFFADDGVYYAIAANNGYKGDLEIAIIPESFVTDIMHEEEDANGVLVENKEVEPEHFALLFEFSGDQRKIRHCIYNCAAKRTGISSGTIENSK
ncbi:phage major tail protein, phi13 family [Butyrivibrio proteoclasticus]|uniref:Phage major tail protein, phi13 family n=2 Tax=Butyrivibrio proteoclasticus TaxID=43305 RepID=A0A1I5SUU3_9FIRM|nr:phage major tail protein, phi13 family [Butyrivibrio proteoclasticus]